jgi:hypothetical protein
MTVLTFRTLPTTGGRRENRSRRGLSEKCSHPLGKTRDIDRQPRTRTRSGARITAITRTRTQQNIKASAETDSRRLLRRGFQVLLQPRHQLDQVAGAEPIVELMHQYVVPRILHSTSAARQREQVGTAGDTTERARLHR